MAEGKMTHRQIVNRVARWLKTAKRMTVVMSELRTWNSETPDVIGWLSGAASIMVECKTSRSDFHADKKKVFRREESRGMGDRRYFAAQNGILRPEDMPDGWGLLEIYPHQIRVAVDATFKSADKRAECVMLMSALRRLEISTAVYVVHDADELAIEEENKT